MKKLIGALAVALALGPWRPAFADQPLVWQTPLGTFGLPFQASEALIGYDGILKEAIAGFSVPVYQDPIGLLALQIGAIAPWQSNGPTIEPYVAAGHDFAREIPALKEYKSFHINAFGRYSTQQGRAGAGIAVSYSFGQSNIVDAMGPSEAQKSIPPQEAPPSD